MQPCFVAILYPSRIVLYRPVGIGQLSNCPEILRRRLKISVATNYQLNILPGSTRLHDTQRIWENFLIHKHLAHICFHLFARAQVVHHRYRLSRCRSFIQERAVRQGKPRQIRHQRLEIEQCLQTPLTYLCLIGRIGGVPHGVLQHITTNDGRRNRTIPTAPDITPRMGVLLRCCLQRIEHLLLRQRLGQLDRLRQENVLRHYLSDELFHRLCSNGLEHGLLVGFAQTNVSLFEVIYFHNE